VKNPEDPNLRKTLNLRFSFQKMATFSGLTLMPGATGNQQPFGGVTLQAAATPAQPKVLTADNISKYAQAARKRGGYWRVNAPTRGLQLGGAPAYVAKQYPNQNPNNPFLYFPDLAMAGTAEDIYNTLARANQNQLNVGELNNLSGGRFGRQQGAYPLNLQTIIENSINPANAQQAEWLRAMTAQNRAQQKPSTAKFPLELHVQIGQAIRQAKNPGRAAPAAGGAAGATGGARGGRATAGDALSRQIANFEQVMERALGGLPNERVLNVAGFAPNFTGVRKVPPTTTSRATGISPRISVGGREVAVPLVAPPSNGAQFQQYVNSVVGGSRYAQYAPQIMQAYQQALSGSQVGGLQLGQQYQMPMQQQDQGGYAANLTQQPLIAPMGQSIAGMTGVGTLGVPVAPAGFSGAGGNQIAMGTGASMANLGQGVNLTSPSGRVRTGNTPTAGSPVGGFTLPSANLPGLSQQPLGAASPGLPNMGGMGGLPSMGGMQGGLPSIGGGMGGLPTIGGMGQSSLPQIGGMGQSSLPQIGGMGQSSLPQIGGMQGGLPQIGGMGQSSLPQIGGMQGGLPTIGGFQQ
jgi:hypothetical protein